MRPIKAHLKEYLEYFDVELLLCAFQYDVVLRSSNYFLKKRMAQGFTLSVKPGLTSHFLKFSK